ncbi:MAG: hypothetical protein HY060_12045 [Proteobacteria bacterium]|nr:hypothetical protein [Pseudomonadota bacterium]
MATLEAVAALVERARAAPWFAAVGAPLGAAGRGAAGDYLRGLGFAGLPIDGVADWPQAKALADAPDWDPAWWHAEERLRHRLLDAATSRHARAPLLAALTEAMMCASETAHDRAAHALASAGVADDALARAAAGAGAQACYLAALAAAAGSAADHLFGAKFSLFEAGRWPLGIVAGRLRLF